MKHDRYAWNKTAPSEYRWRCGERTGRWFASYRAAGNAAVKAGLATWSGRVLFTGPLVSIESRCSRAIEG